MSENETLSADDRFLCGFYMTPGSFVWDDFAEEQSMTTAEAWEYWIERMVDDGFNAFQIGVANDPEDEPIPENPEVQYIGFFNDLSETHNFKMIPYLESADLSKDRPEGGMEEYLEALNDRIESRLEKAAECILEYKDCPNVLAFAVGEEPSSCEYMHWLMRYYDLIRKYERVVNGVGEKVGDVKFDLLFMTTPEYRPLYLSDIHGQMPIIGVDPYIFWWEFSGDCYLAAPSAKGSGAFGWYVRKLKALGKYAREFNTHFRVVFTAASQETIITEKQLDDLLGKKEEAKRRIDKYAVAGEHGWLLLPWGLDAGRTPYLKYFRYYHPPQNCTRAMVWLAVMMGAKSIFQWALKPTPREVPEIIKYDVPRELYLAWKRKSGHNYWRVHILGLENNGTYMLEEYKKACQYLQRFGWLINRMEYDDGQDSSQNFNHNSSPLEITASNLFDNEHDIFSKSFLLPGYSGKIVVLVNGKVGTWCNKLPQLYGSPDEERYRINKWGYVHEDDFTPDTEELPIRVFLQLHNGEGLWDLESGQPLISASDEAAVIQVKPGGGKFLFIGSGDEAASIRKKCGLE